MSEGPTPKSVGHEGMVTVWASDGLYLGCMGIERWKRLLAEDARRLDDTRRSAALITPAAVPEETL